jgi:hypothetical protein
MDEAQPWVGAPSAEYRAVCLYSDGPGQPQCDEPAILHVGVEDANYGTVADYGVIGLPTCGRHAHLARASARFIEEHPHEGFCGFPGTLWLENHCVLDVSGREPARAGMKHKVR